jgi:hypothetical protein
MRFDKTILTLLLIFICSKAFSIEEKVVSDTTKHTVKFRHKKHMNWPHPMYKLPDSMKYYNDCVFTHTYTPSQRLKKYPFNKAVKILVVSYNGIGAPNLILIGKDTARKSPKIRWPLFVFHADTLDLSSVYEHKQLTPSQIKRLTYLTFNTKIRHHFDTDKYIAGPWEALDFPTNALVFYDKKGKVFDYIRMRFDVGLYDSKTNHADVGCKCNQKNELIKQLFIEAGIKFGTITDDSMQFN